MYQPSTTHHPSPSSSRQHNITGYPSSHRRTHIGRLSSLFQRNNYNTHDGPTRLRFLEWARTTFVHLPSGRHDDEVELQDRRVEVVDVPFTRGKPVSRSLFYLGRSTLIESHRGTIQWENYGGRKRKKNRKQCKRRMQRTHRTGRTPRTPEGRLKPSQLQKCLMLPPLCPPHQLLLLPPQLRRWPRAPR